MGKESPSDITVDKFANVFQLNVFSIRRLCQLSASQMQTAGYGSIVDMSSMASISYSPAISTYASFKPATNHPVRKLAFDYCSIIRVNAIGRGAGHRAHARLAEVDDSAGAMRPRFRPG